MSIPKLNIKIIATRQELGYIELAWNHGLHGEHPIHDGSVYYLFEQKKNDKSILVAQISPLLTRFKYSLAPERCGETIKLGIALYDVVSNELGAISWLPIIHTIPNPPELIIIQQSCDNIVKFEWLPPKFTTEIKGYLVERSDNGRDYVQLGVAARAQYIDVGGNYKAPSNGKRYYYRISSITYSGQQSDFIFANTNVLDKELVPVPTYARKIIPNLPIGNYRIQAKGTEGFGDSPWMNIQKLIMPLDTDLPELPQIRMRAITTEGDTSLVIKTRNLSVPMESYFSTLINNDEDLLLNNDEALLNTKEFYEAPPSPIRIRTVAVDGTESLALQAVFVHRINNFRSLVNKTHIKLKNKTEKKVVKHI